MKKQVIDLKEKLTERDTVIDDLKNEVDKLTQLLLNAQNARFGQSSENAYICRTCQENEVKNCVTHPVVAPGLMKHSLASPCAVANVTAQAALGHQPDRSGKHAENFLREFSGCLVTDGYAGYNKVENVTKFGCWAHMKRKWKEAMPKGATVETSKAAVCFQMCNKLFRLEKEFKDLTSKKQIVSSKT